MVIVYKIYSEKGPNVYYGSTTNKYLSNRKATHIYHYRLHKDGKSDIRLCNSFLLFDEYGIENCIFEMIEECNEEDRYSREQFWIVTDENSINRNIPRTKEEAKKIKRELDLQYQKNKDRTEKIQCECGSIVLKYHIARHRKTSKHLGTKK